MKRILYILLAVPLLFSCSRDPYADFYASRDLAEVGDIIYFTNNSLDADAFEWDFGDGTFSTRYDAEHIYTASGIYDVSLTAFSGKNKWDRAFMTVEVLFPTSLEVTVLEYYDEYPVSDASVILYDNLDDWNDEYNPLVEGFTNQYGRVTFSGLYSKRYYVDVWEDYHNNWILAGEDVGFIETDRLIANEMNYFIAFVDYVPPPALKSEGKDRPERNVSIVKVEKLGKREYMDRITAIEQMIEERKAAFEREEQHQEPVRVENKQK
jgi:hypothetical protein